MGSPTGRHIVGRVKAVDDRAQMAAVSAVAATVAGIPVRVAEVDAREAILRAGPVAVTLPRPGTSEGRQLRRWVTQLLVTERLIAAEAAARAVPADIPAPDEKDLLPDAAARLEVGSIAAAALADPRARALFVEVTAGVDVAGPDVAAFHARNPWRFAACRRSADGWYGEPDAAPALDDVRDLIVANLLGAARRRAFRVWLDERRAALVHLAPGYEHPGDPRQPDNTHRH